MAPMARQARRLLSVGKFIFVRTAALISAFLLAGAVFALDGILIGASDGPYIAASMVVAFAMCTACLGLAVAEDWGVRGVWAALAALIVVRAATMGARFTRRSWLVTGWA